MLNDLNKACGYICGAGEQVRHLGDMIGRAVRDNDAGALQRTPAQMAADFGRKEESAVARLSNADSSLQRTVDSLEKNSPNAADSAAAGRAVGAAYSALDLVSTRLPEIKFGAKGLIGKTSPVGDSLASTTASVSEKLKLVATRIGALSGSEKSAEPIASTALKSSELASAKRLGGSSAHAHLMILMARTGESFYFNLSTAGYDTLRRQTSYNIATQDRLTRRPALQAVSKGGESITVSGAIFSKKSGVGQLEKLRGIGFQMAPLTLTTGYGESLGEWYLTRIDEDQTDLFADGLPRKQQFTLEFQRYGEDYSDL